MYKNKFTFLLLTTFLFSSNLFAGSNNEENEKTYLTKRNHHDSDNSSPKRNFTQKQRIINALDSSDLNLDQLLEIEDFFIESTSLLNDPDYCEIMQETLLSIAKNRTNISERLKAANTLFNSEYKPLLSQSHNEVAIEAFIFIATDSELDCKIQLSVLNYLIQYKIYNEFHKKILDFSVFLSKNSEFSPTRLKAANIISSINNTYKNLPNGYENALIDTYGSIATDCSIDLNFRIGALCVILLNLSNCNGESFDILTQIEESLNKTKTEGYSYVLDASKNMFNALKEISKEEYVDLFNLAKQFIEKQGVKNLIDISFIQIIAELSTIKKERRCFLLNTISENFSQKKWNLKDYYNIIKALKSVKDEQISFLLNLIKKVEEEKNWSGSDYSSFIRKINSLKTIEEKNIDSNINIIKNFAEKYDYNKADNYADIIYLLSNTEKKECEDILASIEENFSEEIKIEKLDLVQICSTIKILKKIETKKYKEISTILKNNKKLLNCEHDLFYLCDLFSEIITIFQKNYEFYFDIFSNFLKNGLDFHNASNAIKFLYFIPEDLQQDAMSRVNFSDLDGEEDLEEHEEAYIVFLLNYLKSIDSNNNLKNRLISFWQDCLQSSNENIASILSAFIVEHFSETSLLEESDIVQLAIRTQILVNESSNLQNPFKLHENLLQKKTEKIDLTQLHFWKDFQDQNYSYQLCLNPEFLKSLSDKQIYFTSIPYIEPNILETIFKSMKDRISSNNTLQEIILNTTCKSFSNIEYDVLDGSQYLVNLLNRPIGHKVSAQFKCILKHLLSLPSETTEKSLSEQEDAFLKTFVSILNCPAGRDGGVLQAYGQLPSNKKLKTINKENDIHMNVDTSKIESHKAYDFLDETLQNYIENLFSGTNQLMYNICNLKNTDENNKAVEINEAVHQGLYLRNLIGDLVGSVHKITIDMNASLCYIELINLTKQKALEHFYVYANYNIDLLISFVQLKINEILSNDLSIYNGLANIIENNDESIWELNDQCQISAITKKGTLAVLIKIGAILQQ
ncbi:MAG: hypothetical protein Q8L85_08175 [Alphaproteobacteria bacterium]|nr:hypothetical protein [Alphaproteobacteria bacterium]